MSSFINDLAREAAGPWTPLVASLLGAVVSPVLTSVIGRSAARGAERERAALELAKGRNDQRIRTGDISGSAKFNQTIDQRQYSNTTIHQPPAASSSGGSDMAAWIVGIILLSAVVIIATAWLGLSLLAALPWASTSGAAVLLSMTLRQRRAGVQMSIAAPITALVLAGMCWAVAIFVGRNGELNQAITHVQQHGHKFGDASAGVILWLSAAILLVWLAAVAVLGLTISARLHGAPHPEGKHWTEPFLGNGRFRLWLGIAISTGVLLALIVVWPTARVALGF